MPILRRLRTLRFRLTLMFVIIFGVVQTTLSLVLDVTRSRQLHHDFDQLLLERAENIVTIINSNEDAMWLQGPKRVFSDSLNEFLGPGYFYQIRLARDGDTMARSANLGYLGIPLSDEAAGTRNTGQPAFEDVTGELAIKLVQYEKPGLRIVTLYSPMPDAYPFYLQAARALGPLEDRIQEFRRMVFLFLSLSLAAAGVASWIMARHSFEPIGDIAREARHISARHLDRRIDVPSAGDELAEMVTVINDMLDRLEAAFKSQERLLGDVSHELKTPLAVLRGQAQVLQRKSPTLEEYCEFAASVREEMDHLNDVVDSFLAISRAEGRLSQSALSDVALNEQVVDAVRHCQTVAKQRGIRLLPKLVLTETGEPGPTVIGDAQLLRIMIENLIRNAKKYSPTGSTVEIEVQVNASEVQVFVRDEGPGIPEDHLAHIFERGYRVSQDCDLRQGAGLELAIARGIATLHNGSISVANRPIVGSEFCIRLPLARLPEDASDADSAD